MSTAAVAAIEVAGFDCLATSVSVLRPSLERSGVALPEQQEGIDRLLNQPFALPGSKLSCFFPPRRFFRPHRFHLFEVAWR